MAKLLFTFMFTLGLFTLVGVLIAVGSTSELAAALVVIFVLFTLVWGVAYSIIS